MSRRSPVRDLGGGRVFQAGERMWRQRMMFCGWGELKCGLFFFTAIRQSVVGWEDDRTQVRRHRGMLGFLT